jgi:hypothetical protein
MKRPSKPTLRQKLLISKRGKNPSNYSIVEDKPNELRVIHKHSTKIYNIPKPQIVRELVMV